MSTDDDGGLFNFNPDELDPDGPSGDPGPEDESGDTPAEAASGGTEDEPDTRGEDEHEAGGGQTGMGKGPTGS